MNRINHWNFGLLLVSIVCFVLSLLLENVSFYKLSEKSKVKGFEEILQQKELYLYRLFDDLENTMDTVYSENLFSSLYNELQPKIDNQGMDMFLFESDTLRLWTGNSVGAETQYHSDHLDGEVVLMGNGWFVKKERMVGDWHFVGLILIKNEYPYQNSFLQNNFQEDFHLPYGTRIDSVTSESIYVIHDSWKRELFSLDFSQVSMYSPLQSNGSLVLYFLGIFLLLLYLRHLIKSIENQAQKNTAILLGAVVLLLFNAKFLMWYRERKTGQFEFELNYGSSERP